MVLMSPDKWAKVLNARNAIRGSCSASARPGSGPRPYRGQWSSGIISNASTSRVAFPRVITTVMRRVVSTTPSPVASRLVLGSAPRNARARGTQARGAHGGTLILPVLQTNLGTITGSNRHRSRFHHTSTVRVEINYSRIHSRLTLSSAHARENSPPACPFR